MKSLKTALFIFILIFALDCAKLRDGYPPALSLRVMTFNIHIGKGMDGKIDLERIAEVINSSGAELVALQEVDRWTRRCGRVDELETLKLLTNMKGVFGKTIDYQGGEYGIAILTSLRIIDSHFEHLPKFNNRERRGFLLVTVEKKGRQIAFVCTHLGLDSQERKRQVERLLAKMKTIRLPLIIAGDFNELPDRGVTKLMGDGFLDVARLINKEQPTYPSDNPEKRIDYIWLRKSDRWKARNCEVLKTLSSDHRPLWADVELP